MKSSFAIWRCCLLVLILIGLGACSSDPAKKMQPKDYQQQAEHQLENGQFSEASKSFEKAAKDTHDNGLRAQLQLQAALTAQQAGETSRSKKLTDDMTGQHLLQGEDRERYRLLELILKALSLPSEQGIAYLPPPNARVPDPMGAMIWQTRADILFGDNNYVAGIHSLVKKNLWLEGELAQEQNNSVIFDHAVQAVEAGQDSHSHEARFAFVTTKGWLALAELKQERLRTRSEKKRALTRWRIQYPNHPATGALITREFFSKKDSATEEVIKPVKVGRGPVILALPLSGKLSSAAAAIRDGFNLSSPRVHGRPVEVIDTSSLSAKALLKAAQDKDAAMVVGPLTKDKVDDLAELSPSFPVLALNATNNVQLPQGFYQFGLIPEDEARTAAEHAVATKRLKALVLAADTNQGHRIVRAFKSKLEHNGGEVVAYDFFQENHYDHQRSVQSVVKPYLDGEDVDVVFIAASPAHARVLRSQLRFYRAGKLPVLATSSAHSSHAETRQNLDLNGVDFTEIPWLIDPSPELASIQHRALQKSAQSAKSAPKLLAMGIDAHTLATLIVQQKLETRASLSGYTGMLTLMPSGQIHRQLAWGTFVKGEAILLQSAQTTVNTAQADPADAANE